MASSGRVNILIPAAGESRRFRDAGYSLPKPFLPVCWEGSTKTMLEHVLDCLPNSHHDVVVGIRPGAHEDHLPKRVSQVVLIESTTGQADTVRQMVGRLPTTDAVITMDCDTLVLLDVVEFAAYLRTHRAAVCVTSSVDPNMSRVDCVPNPSTFVEKGVISQWGVVSVRGFDSAGVLREVLDEIVEEHERVGTEPYLSHALNRYPGVKYAHVISNFHDWGTPEKLRQSGAFISTEETV